jgi:hypothetical protein
VDANGAAAFGASPSCFFRPDECSQAIFFDKREISDHAHMVFRPVPCVQAFQVLAGECPAFETESCLSIAKRGAVLDFASNAGEGLIGGRYSATGAFVLFP